MWTSSRGHSGIRPAIVDALLALANANVLPVIPAKGSVEVRFQTRAKAVGSARLQMTVNLLGESDGDIQDKGLTPAEWAERYGSNGVAAIARQRLFWYANKGGVATPGGPVHGTHQTGHAFPSGEKPVKIGGKDGRQYP